jgi:CheY-like chemotaxis protein
LIRARSRRARLEADFEGLNKVWAAFGHIQPIATRINDSLMNWAQTFYSSSQHLDGRTRTDQVRDGVDVMHVLIVESMAALSEVWKRHLERQGMQVTTASTGDEACARIAVTPFEVIILDLVLSDGSAFAVADIARFRRPQTSVIFVTDTAFFSDGSIFSLMPNARAFVQTSTPPEDLAAMAHHYATAD